MAHSLDAVTLALLATLEARAKKNGEKSILKGVVGRLAEAGGHDDLIAAISALPIKKKVPMESIAKPKVRGMPRAKAEAKPRKIAKRGTQVAAS
jgi:hypothetical protein